VPTATPHQGHEPKVIYMRCGISGSLADMSRYAIPRELQGLRQWVCSALPSKRPVRPNGDSASVIDPTTWSSFGNCCRAADRRRWGVAFVFTAQDPYAVLDLDHVRADCVIEPWAQEIVDGLDSYTELSMSGSGLHVIVRATKPGPDSKAGRVELYDRGKAMTLTGDVQGTKEERSEIRTVDLAALYSRLRSLDPSYVPTPQSGKRTNGKAAGNRASQSERDFSIIALLDLALGRPDDPDVIERAFRQQYATEYAARNQQKGLRCGVNYIRYSIERYLTRRMK
jgi:primase-polymerase (primpol)-like protein